MGDIDGNGRLDFVCSDLAGGSLLVFLQGAAGFPAAPSRTLEGGVLASGVAVEDFDADGLLDAAVSLVAENRVTFPVAKDRFNIVARRWLGAQSPLPSLFFVRTDGTIASVHRGYSQDGALVLAEEIEKVLGVKVSPPVAPAPEPVDAGVPAEEPAPKTKKGAKPAKKKK